MDVVGGRAGRCAAIARSTPSIRGVGVEHGDEGIRTLLCAVGRDMAIARDPEFDEVRRDEPFDGDYETRRTAWVEGRLDDRHEG